jgi:hypothetical protein
MCLEPLVAGYIRIIYHIVLRPAQELYEDVTIAGEGLQNLGLCSALRAFSWAGRDFYRATPAVTQSLGFSGVIRRPPHSVAP